MEFVNQMSEDGANHRTALQLDRLMRRFGSCIHTRAKDVDTCRVGPLGGMTLTTLADIEPAALKDLATHLQRDKSQVTKSVQLLEVKGLVARRKSPHDGRVMLVYLTDEGQQMVQLIRTTMSEVVDELLSPLSPSERALLSELLERVDLVNPR